MKSGILRCCLVAVLLAGTLSGLPVLLSGGWAPAAWAGDDDDSDGGNDSDSDDDDSDDDGDSDDDDDDGDDDDDRDGRPRAGRGEGGGSDATTGRTRQVPGIAQARHDRPVAAPELVTIGLSPADLALLLREGFIVLEEQDLPGVASDMRRLSPPTGMSATQARDRIRRLVSGAASDLNHYYYTNQAPSGAHSVADPICQNANCAALELVDWPGPTLRAKQCQAELPRIGIIDTGINIEHEFLAGARIELHRLADGDVASAKIHGTAIASMLAAPTGGRVEGLLPEASYLAADIFSRANGEERADAASLIRGLDLMEQRGIRVVNLSLAGPDNAALAQMVARLVEERDMVLVAAVGNGGRDRPAAYPAAYPEVIGVTAVDRRGRLYAQAQRGAPVDLAAPGVGLLLATSISGARPQTGTSYAVPFVTAAAALLLADDPGLTSAEVKARLADGARDLGAEGRDDLFGSGLLQAGELCGQLPAPVGLTVSLPSSGL